MPTRPELQLDRPIPDRTLAALKLHEKGLSEVLPTLGGLLYRQIAQDDLDKVRAEIRARASRPALPAT